LSRAAELADSAPDPDVLDEHDDTPSCFGFRVHGGSYLPGSAWRAPETVRFGHFPNITHVQALVAHNLSRQGKGWFEQRLGDGVNVEWYVYNAGPSAMEAIFAKSIDLTYVGPGPALNAYTKSRGDEIRIIAGAAEGGAALVVQSDSALKTAADFRGRKIATPQLGNTQDIAARAWLSAGGLSIRQNGGDAKVLPTANPDQLQLFKQGLVDAVWTVEPWVSRLELEAGGKILINDSAAITTVLAATLQVRGRAKGAGTQDSGRTRRADGMDQEQSSASTATSPRRIDSRNTRGHFCRPDRARLDAYSSDRRHIAGRVERLCGKRQVRRVST